ncbi:hypothetical protein F6X40_10975 [Paraburkholderia sp. UCT31]|nr:hypothetical protein [Paraburkholderia sp. UCT31]
MKLEPTTFAQLRRLAPTLDDLLHAGEVEHEGQARCLLALSELCAELHTAYTATAPPMPSDEEGTTPGQRD